MNASTDRQHSTVCENESCLAHGAAIRERNTREVIVTFKTGCCDVYPNCACVDAVYMIPTEATGHDIAELMQKMQDAGLRPHRSKFRLVEI